MSDIDEFEDDYYVKDDFDAEGDFDAAMRECGVGADGYCGYAGSEFCDWACPMMRFGFHGTEVLDDELESDDV